MRGFPQSHQPKSFAVVRREYGGLRKRIRGCSWLSQRSMSRAQNTRLCCRSSQSQTLPAIKGERLWVKKGVLLIATVCKNSFYAVYSRELIRVIGGFVRVPCHKRFVNMLLCSSDLTLFLCATYFSCLTNSSYLAVRVRERERERERECVCMWGG